MQNQNAGYLAPPTDDLSKMENKTTLELAKQIKYKGFLNYRQALWFRCCKTRPKFRGFFAELASEKIRFIATLGTSAFKQIELELIFAQVNYN